MANLWIISICLGAYLLGSCPFSVWIGKFALSRDIRNYGDGNPGATNVIKAGSVFWGIIAIIADIVKGIPFVLLGRVVFASPIPVLYIIAFCAVLGHAYSPFLGFRGGKALAVFAGTLLAIPLWDMILSFALLMFIGFLFVKNDSWTVILGAVGSVAYLLVISDDVYKLLFIASILLLFVIKHSKSMMMNNYEPGRIIVWLRSRKSAGAGGIKTR